MTTSIRFHLRPSAKVGRHTGKLFIRVIHNRLTKHIPRQYAVYADEWDDAKKRIITPASGDQTERCRRLSLIDDAMKNDLRRLHEIVDTLSGCGEFTVSDIVEKFTDSLKRNTIMGYAAASAGRLREQGRERTARAYRTAARSLTAFNDGKDVFLSQIDAALMAGYEQHLMAKGLALNTISFYLRNLRAMYFRAVNERIIPKQADNPFAGTHTGVYETRRRALDNTQIKALAALEFSLLERMEELTNHKTEGSDAPAESMPEVSGLYDALMYFLFSYHARGMSFVDLAHLRKQDIGTDELTYRRRKTGGMLEVKVTEPMRMILNHFAMRTVGSEFVFPVIDLSRGNGWRQYETGLKRQNRLLKILARMAGIVENLSTHAARHTWATLAKRLNYPVEVIGEALGHRDVKTTTIYLASFDRTTMDELSVRLSDTVQAA